MSTENIFFGVFMGKKYIIKFDFLGLIAFLLLLAPNIVWNFVPAPRDVLRIEASTETLVLIEKICQVLIGLCLTLIVVKREFKRKFPVLIILYVVFLALYYFCWIIYYVKVDAFAVMGVTFLHCFAFICFAFYKNNMIAIVPIAIFTISHFMYTISNFAF